MSLFSKSQNKKRTEREAEVNAIRDMYGWNESVAPASAKEWEGVLTELVLETKDHKMEVPGYCDACDENQRFLLDDMYCEFSNFETLNDFKSAGGLCFRERMVCPKCGLNSRQRALFKILPDYVDTKSKIYMLEQVTPPYRAVVKKYRNVVGSEYLGDGVEPGFVNKDGIRHEDATHLSFADDSFDCVISQDVFEHVFDIDACLREMSRVLRLEGTMIVSVPFYTMELKTRIRAKLVDGKVEHLLEPVYHGNPMGGGSLLVYDYGWDLLDKIKAAGFSEVYIRKEYSPSHGIIGADTVWFIIAKK